MIPDQRQLWPGSPVCQERCCVERMSCIAIVRAARAVRRPAEWHIQDQSDHSMSFLRLSSVQEDMPSTCSLLKRNIVDLFQNTPFAQSASNAFSVGRGSLLN